MTTGLLTHPAQESLLTPEAFAFLTDLHCRFEARRQERLREREARQRRYDLGQLPDFPRASRSLRAAEWTVSAPPVCLATLTGQRLVGANGPPDAETLCRGLSSEASFWVADFDDCFSPTWENIVEGHENLRRACAMMGRDTAPGGTPRRPAQPILFLRPRDWSLEEKHFLVDHRPIAASLFDFGCFFWNNARTLLEAGRGLCFCLPKLEDHLEARLWKEIFSFSEQAAGLAHGSIRASIAIETLPAVFEMEEILFELRDYALALECSPANYLASFAKACRAQGESLLPQRDDLSMDQPFLHAYQELLVHTSHKRGVLALSGAVAQLSTGVGMPGSATQHTSIRDWVHREMEMGFDGILVSEEHLIPLAQRELERPAKASSRTGCTRCDCYVSSRDLFSRALGRITMEGLRENLESTLEYLKSWLSGRGRLERAAGAESMATAELRRTQLRQWIRHSARLAGGRRVDRSLVEGLMSELLASKEDRLGTQKFTASRYPLAAELLLRGCVGDPDLPLPVQAYAFLN